MFYRVCKTRDAGLIERAITRECEQLDKHPGDQFFTRNELADESESIVFVCRDTDLFRAVVQTLGLATAKRRSA